MKITTNIQEAISAMWELYAKTGNTCYMVQWGDTIRVQRNKPVNGRVMASTVGLKAAR